MRPEQASQTLLITSMTWARDQLFYAPVAHQHSAGAGLNNAPGNGDKMAKRTEGTKTLLSQVFLCILLAVVYATGAPSADGMELDNRKITCRAFLAAGQNNMAALISWLRGYHAGKTEVIPYQSPSPYGGRLGFYCKQHPDDNLIEASEKVLTELDHGM